jgi:localization factor PodJL
MANALPWSVRGIDPDIREQAVEAAHRSGLSVGQWLNQILAGNLDDEDEEEAFPPRARAGGRRRLPPRQRADTQRAETLGERLERLAHGQRQTSAGRAIEPFPDNARILDLIENAVEAIERLEKQQASPAAERPSVVGGRDEVLVEALRSFERRLETLAPPLPRTPDVAPLPGLPGQTHMADPDPAFTQTLAEIETRRRSLDGDTRASRIPAAPAAGGGHAIEAMSQQLAALVTRIDDMRTEQRPAENGLQARLDDLANRIEEWRSTPSDSVTSLRAEIAALSNTLTALTPNRLATTLEDAFARTTERAIRAQTGDSERVLESLGRLNEDVRAVMREVTDNRVSERLGQELGNLSKRLDLVANSVGGQRLDDLARDLHSVKGMVEKAAKSHPADLLARKLDDLSHKIERQDDRGVLLAIDSLNEQVRGLVGGGIKGLESRLAEMTREMKKIAADKQPLPQMSAIADRLERIDRLLDHRPDTPMGGLDAIAQSLETISGKLDRDIGHPAPELAVMLSDLSSRFDQLQMQEPDTRSLDRLQDEVSRVFQKLDKMDGAPSGLDGLERSVADLFARIDQTRHDMRDLAERAAQQAAEQAVKNAPQAESNDTLAAEGLLLIKRDLSEFKAAQSEAERRTRGTLEALHGTLEGIVSKLGQLDAPRPEIRHVAPSVAEPQTTAPREQAPPPARREPDAPAIEVPRRADAQTMPRDAKPKPNIDADLPLEPGVAPGMSPASDVNDPRSQFLAMARRAAQAAHASSEAILAEGAKPAKGAQARQLAASGSSFIARARKPILLGLAALIFSIGALKVLSGRLGQSDDPIAPMPPKPVVSTPAGPATAPTETESRDSKDDPQNTGSTGHRTPPVDQQTLPTIQPNGMMTLPGNKRSQRLSETSAVTQADPMTVGSINPDGTTKPIETGRAIILELVGLSALKGQDKLRDAAIQGSHAAWYEIGVRYADGKGMPRDGKLAARWFEQAALAGHGPSQYRLGSLYREGKIMPKEPNIAFQWFDRAAAQGHVLAMHNAAVLLAEGVHGAPDYAGAALWFKRAAEHGIKDSQFNVAILFARGLGVNQDLTESYRWFAIAAQQGDLDAAKKRDDIAARLTKEQIAKENDRAKTFKPMPANPTANDPGNWEKVVRQGA